MLMTNRCNHTCSTTLCCLPNIRSMTNCLGFSRKMLLLLDFDIIIIFGLTRTGKKFTTVSTRNLNGRPKYLPGSQR